MMTTSNILIVFSFLFKYNINTIWCMYFTTNPWVNYLCFRRELNPWPVTLTTALTTIYFWHFYLSLLRVGMPPLFSRVSHPWGVIPHKKTPGVTPGYFWPSLNDSRILNLHVTLGHTISTVTSPTYINPLLL